MLLVFINSIRDRLERTTPGDLVAFSILLGAVIVFLILMALAGNPF